MQKYNKYNRLVLLCIFLPLCIYAFEYDVKSKIYGNGFVALTETIASININPAGLSRVIDSELLITTDRIFAFNYLAIGVHFKKIGNFGISIINMGQPKASLAYAAMLYKDIIRFGINSNFIIAENLRDFGYSLGSGFLFCFRRILFFEEISVGLSANNFLRSTGALYFYSSSGVSVNIANFFIAAFGVRLDERLEFTYSVGAEVRLFRFINILAGYERDNIKAGLGLLIGNERLFLSTGYNYTAKSFDFLFAYQRLFRFWPEPMIHPAKRRKPKKPVKLEEKEPIIDESKALEIMEQQRIHLQAGLTNYGRENYTEARKEWEQVIKLWPDNELAEQAKKYIETLDEKLQTLKELRKK